MSLVSQRGNEILSRLGGNYGCMGAEVGVYDGRLSGYLLREQLNLVLLMVDRWGVADDRYKASGSQMAQKNHEEWEVVRATARANVAFAHNRAVMLQGEAVDVANMVQFHSLDFVFLDADHSYEAVAEDIECWWPKVRRGGWLCGHDWDHPEAHLGHDKTDRTWGVKRAVLDRFSIEDIQIGDNRTWFIQKPI